MNEQIRSIAEIYAFNSLSLKAGLSDLSDAQAGRRWREGQGSSITYLVGHLLSTRYGLLKRFGKSGENPFASQFGATAQPQDGSAYPSMVELLKVWCEVALRLEAMLPGLAATELEAPAEGFPVADRTARGALMFLAWHESYHVGQIGLMRTEMGLPSIQARLYEALKTSK